MRLSGRLVTGRGEGAYFTNVDWVREQLMTALGIDPYPGTLNLMLETATDRAQWRALKALPGSALDSSNRAWCSARCYPIRVEGWLPGAIVLPDVAEYPEFQIEIVAALPIRQTLSLRDGDRVFFEASKPLHVRAVIFDVDGTLVDSLEAYRIVAERAAAPHGFAITEEVVRHALNTGRSFWDLVLAADQSDRREVILTLKKEASLHWPDVLHRHGRVYPGLRGTLETLRDRGARIAIVTGSDGSSFEPLQREGLMELFEVIVTGRDVAHGKPDPEGLLKCAATLGIDACECVYVGDTPLDVQTAKAAGTACVAVLSGAGDSALLSASGPERIIRSHAGLPGIVEIP